MGKTSGFFKDQGKAKKANKKLRDALDAIASGTVVDDVMVVQSDPANSTTGTAVYVIAVETDVGMDSSQF